MRDPPLTVRTAVQLRDLHIPREGVSFPTRSRVTRDLFSRTHSHSRKPQSVGRRGHRAAGEALGLYRRLPW